MDASLVATAQAIASVGSATLLALCLLLILKGVLVPGLYYDEMKAQRDRLLGVVEGVLKELNDRVQEVDDDHRPRPRTPRTPRSK